MFTSTIRYKNLRYFVVSSHDSNRTDQIKDSVVLSHTTLNKSKNKIYVYVIKVVGKYSDINQNHNLYLSGTNYAGLKS